MKPYLRNILEKTILAASGHNLQPWAFRIINDNQFNFYLNRTKKMPYFEYRDYSLYISAGTALENMRVAAKHEGFETNINYFPDKNKEDLIAWVELQKKEGPSNSPHYAALDKRCSNRKPYHSRKILSPSVVSRLEKTAAEIPSIKLMLVPKSNQKHAKLKHWMARAEQMGFEIHAAHRDIFEHFRFDKHRAKSERDGLDIRTCEMSAFIRFMFKQQSNWKFQEKVMNQWGLGKGTYDYIQKEINTSSALGMILSNNRDPESFVRGGEAVERMWHEATLAGLAIRPLTFLFNHLYHVVDKNFGDLSPAQIKELSKVKEDFFKEFGIKEENGLVFLFRIGYAPPPSYRSLRRSLENFIR